MTSALSEISADHCRAVHILFADDDPGMRALVVINLEAEGFTVTTAVDAGSRLRMLRA